MARPTTLSLTATDHRWRTVEMPGANASLQLVPLASHPDDFAILGSFPAGFARDTPGGYHAAETFIVLEGELILDGHTLGPGDLTHVPAEILRTDMRAPDGCLVLAWFSGPAEYLSPEELGTCTTSISSVSLIGNGAGRGDGCDAGVVLSTPEAEWSVVEQGATAHDTLSGDCVDLALTTWCAAGLDCSAPVGPVLVRTRR